MKKRIITILMVPVVFAICFPVIFIVVNAFASPEQLSERFGPVINPNMYPGYAVAAFLPDGVGAESYKELLLYQPGFFVLFWNSVKICFSVVLGQLIIAVPAAWGFARYDFRGRRILFALYILLMLMPFQVLMLSEYILFNKMGILDTLLTMILPGIFSTFPVFILYNFFRDIPDSVIEAARLDGASELIIFFSIGVPYGFSGIAAVMVLQFIEYWNLVEQPMIFIDSPDKMPLSLYLPSVNLDNICISFAAAVITMIPSYLVFRAGQDKLESGIAASAVRR